MNKWIKAVDQNGNCFHYLREKISLEKTDAKLKAGLSFEFSIRKFMYQNVFKTEPNPLVATPLVL